MNYISLRPHRASVHRELHLEAYTASEWECVIGLLVLRSDVRGFRRIHWAEATQS